MLASGSLDTTFDVDGILNSHLGLLATGAGAGSVVEGLAVSVQTDGKIVVAGTVAFTASDYTRVFAAARFNLDGTLDASFGNEATGDLDLIPGLATIDFDSFRDTLPSSAAIGRDLLIDSAGRIVITGNVNTPTDSGIGLARLNADGTLDASFGTGGKVITTDGLTSTVEDAFAVAIQSDGTLVVGGRKATGAALDFMLARYDGTSGAIIGSVVATDFAGGTDFGYDIAVQPDDKIVQVGSATPTGMPRQFGIVRYNADGTLDTSFDPVENDGKVLVDVTVPVGTTDEARAVAIDGTKIVVAGSTLGSSGRSWIALTRLNSDGSIDTSFNDTGSFSFDTAPGTAGYGLSIANGKVINIHDVRGLTIQQDGKYVIAGSAGNNSDATARQIFVGRLLATGAEDTSFDSTGLDGSLNGFVATHVLAGTATEELWDVAMAPDGKIVAAGRTAGADMLVVRYDSGQAIANPGGPYFLDEPGGSVVLAGSAIGTGTLTYLWDLDNDGIFGEAAGPGAYGDENGPTPTFSVSARTARPTTR